MTPSSPPAPHPFFRSLPLLALASALVSAVPAWAQEPRGGGITITPSLGFGQSYSDNTGLTQFDKRSEAVTQITPAVRISSRTGRVQGSLDYALSAQVYANDTSRSGFTNALAAAFTVEAIEQVASVDVRGNISQESISAFGVQSPTPNLRDRNRTEVRSLSVSPFVRGRFSDLANVEARMTWTKTSSTSNQGTDATSLLALLRAYGGRGPYGWSADVTDLTNDYELGRETSNQRVNLGVSYRPHYEWLLNARAGRETDTVRSLVRESTTNFGLGVTWTPTERTVINLQADRRFFGNGYSFSASHRMVRSLLRVSDTRDTSDNGANNRGLNFAGAYDALFQQLAPFIPDPALRDAQVRLILFQQGGFLTRAVSLQRRQDASVVLQGVKLTLSMTAFRSDSQRLDNTNTFSDDLLLAGRVRQHGYNLGASYTLSSIASASLGYTSTTTLGVNTLGGNQLKTLIASFNTQLARRVSFSLSARHVVFESTTQPYTENGGQASISLQF